MQMTSRVELGLCTEQGKPHHINLKVFGVGATYFNNQMLGSTPYEAIGALKKAITELEALGELLTVAVTKDKEQSECGCLLKSLKTKSELPYGCDECMGY